MKNRLKTLETLSFKRDFSITVSRLQGKISRRESFSFCFFFFCLADVRNH